jgi:hypothetical protein
VLGSAHSIELKGESLRKKIEKEKSYFCSLTVHCFMAYFLPESLA